MNVLGRILRTVSLAMLFGGSAAIVFAAIVLVRAAKAKGIPVPEAAANNAPVFISYAKVNLAFGVILLVGEALDFAKRKQWNLPTKGQYVCSLLCVITTMIFAFAIVPPMERLLPNIKTDEQAHQEFQRWHKISQPVFGTTILLALASLILPIFGAMQTATDATTGRENS